MSHFDSVDEKNNEIVHQDSSLPQLDVEGGRATRKANQYDDEAKRILEEAGGSVEYTLEDNKRILREIDLYVCIPLCLVYLMQQLDKSSISYAAVFGLQKETGLHGTQFSWLSSIVYVSEIVVQPLSSYALIVFPVKYWLMFNMAGWSITTACTAICHNFTGLMICRALLGCFEATILPSAVMITQMWWTRREQAYRTVAVQCANSGAVFVGPLLSWAIGHVKGTVRPYQGIFLFMGLVSFCTVPYLGWSLPSSPVSARFLKNGNDRVIAIERLRENNTGMKSSKVKWDQVAETFRDPKTWLWALIYLTAGCSNGFFVFGGLITQGFGFSPFQTLLMQLPTGAISIISILISVYISNRIKTRWIVIAVLALSPLGGAVALTQVKHEPAKLLVCYYFLWVYAGIAPLLYTWGNTNSAGTTKRVVLFAIQFSCQCAGNIVNPQVYLAKEKPYYHTGLYVSVAGYSLLILEVICMRLYLGYLNKQQAKKRVALGLPEVLEDMSLMTSQEAEAYRIRLTASMAAEGANEHDLFTNSFDDLTDKQNPMFSYIL